MKTTRSKILLWASIGAVVVTASVFALWPRAIDVDTVEVQQQHLTVSIDADGIVRAHKRFTIAMPASGVLERVDIEPGTRVTAGQVLGYVVPPEINAQQREEATSRIKSMEAAGVEITEQLNASRITVDQAKRRAERLLRLGSAGAVPKEQVENAGDAYNQALRQLESWRARQRAHAYELQALRSIVSARPGQQIPLRSPTNGIVLRRYEQSERTVLAGTPIIEVGDTANMEVEIDVLSTDAVRITPGMHVQLTGWGGDTLVRATVCRVEPAARTRVSALGIEEQRVSVFADITHCPSELGDGYRVEASIITSQVHNTMCVPLGALLRRGNAWHVFVDEDGRARLRAVTLGLRNSMMTSITAGVQLGEHVLMHPPEALEDGDRVK